jgi:hypothetical protein
MKISIPKPCHENWNAMLPKEQGRFCLKCSKTVIDFSKKSKDEITAFFKEASGKICGKFTIHQIEKPKSFSILNKRIAKFAVALYFVFGGFLFTSCSENKGTLGEPNVEQVIDNNQDDTLKSFNREKVKDDTINTISTKKNKVSIQKKPQNQEFMGLIEVIQNQQVETLKGDVMIED